MATLAAKTIDYVLSFLPSGASTTVSNVATPTAFIGTWTAVTTKLGLGRLGQSSRKLRQRKNTALKLLDAVAKDKETAK